MVFRTPTHFIGFDADKELAKVARKNDDGFTLVELLVVVTIITILIAILLPSMQKTLIQANLAVCMTNLHSIAGGAQQYAVENKNAYPYRPQLRSGSNWKRPNCLVDAADPVNQNDLKYINGYIPFKSLADPFSGRINIDKPHTTVHVFANYELWFGATFPGFGGLNRLSDRLEFMDPAVSTTPVKLPILAGDEDKILNSVPSNYGTHNAHGDTQARMSLEIYDVPQGLILSRYFMPGTPVRPPLDSQFVFTDGSAHRYINTEWNAWTKGGPMYRIPYSTGTTSVADYSLVPQR